MGVPGGPQIAEMNETCVELQSFLESDSFCESDVRISRM
jgi:hypothetical protein